MTTLRVAKRRKFTTVDRQTVNDDRLSFRARGILIWLLDKPDDWTCSSESLAREAKEGRDAIRTALKELEDAGYLRRRKFQNEQGHWMSEWTIYETSTDDWKSDVGSPDVGEPGPITEDCLPKTETERTPPNPPEGGDVLRPGVKVFDVFWALYPRKVGKPAAERAWRKAEKAAEQQAIFAGLSQWSQYWDERGEPEFVPHPSTWLNQERWNDQPPRLAKPATKAQQSKDAMQRVLDRHSQKAINP